MQAKQSKAKAKTENKTKTVTRSEAAQFHRTLQQHLSARTANRLARQSGFQQRQPKKLFPSQFVLSACLLITQPTLSLRSWALLIGLLLEDTFSKQALHERLTAAAVSFLHAVLQALLASVAGLASLPTPPCLRPFRRVLLEDSTSLSLAEKLAAAFPGPSNQKGPGPGLLKIQAAYDLRSHTFVHFSLSSFRRNDQAASADVLDWIGPGDLLIRDLGYFVTRVLEGLQLRGAFFLSRLHLNATLWEREGRRPFDLRAALRRHGRLDVDLSLGPNRLPVRLVAVPVPPAVAAERRRKARHNRDRRSPPSAQRLALLGWQIFITNVPRTVWNARTVAEAYGLRGRIETVFKAWKSHFHFRALPEGSAQEVQAMVYAKLIFITLFEVCFWRPALRGALTAAQPPPSLLKLAQLLEQMFLAQVLEELGIAVGRAWARQVRYHCGYEKRRRAHFLSWLTA